MASRPRIPKTPIRRAIGEAVLPNAIDSAAGVDVAEVPDFDEGRYLRAYPDIADAVRRGVLASGLTHYLASGRVEGRLEKPAYRALLAASEGMAPPQVVLDTWSRSPAGSTLITGWTDDRTDPLTEIDLATVGESGHRWSAFPRLVRADVDRTLEAAPGRRFGFLLVAAPSDASGEASTDASMPVIPNFRFASGGESQPKHREPVIVSDADLRDLALAALPAAGAGEIDAEAAYRLLDQHAGVQIAAINQLVASQARANRLVEFFGPVRGRFKASIITTWRGGVDQIVPFLAAFGGGPGGERYECIIVVPNSEQFEPAMRAARLAEATLGVSLIIVLLPGGDPSGTGGAAADVARSDRLIFVDQAIFPRERDWAAAHSALLDNAPSEQRKLFGGLLFDTNGSLSHGGYYFDRETSFRVAPRCPARKISALRLKSVAHPAPSIDRRFSTARPVLGISAAFLSVDRSWFETLGGFSGQYSRAEHEDIDLCLRSLKRGVPAWCHPLPMWHFDRRPPLRPEPGKGGALFNAWLLHRQWDEMIVPDLLGPEPVFSGGP